MNTERVVEIRDLVLDQILGNKALLRELGFYLSSLFLHTLALQLGAEHTDLSIGCASLYATKPFGSRWSVIRVDDAGVTLSPLVSGLLLFGCTAATLAAFCAPSGPKMAEGDGDSVRGVAADMLPLRSRRCAGEPSFLFTMAWLLILLQMSSVLGFSCNFYSAAIRSYYNQAPNYLGPPLRHWLCDSCPFGSPGKMTLRNRHRDPPMVGRPENRPGRPSIAGPLTPNARSGHIET